MDFNIRQKNIIFAKDPNILCLATAAAGKTRTLVGRIERLLDGGVNPSSIVAFTFTNQAAEEMRKRLGDKCKNMFIGTIHSYANKICNSAGVGTSNDIAEERFDKIIEKALKVSWDYYPQVEYLFVDEFQDTDPLQYDFILKIPAKNRFYVGDERQFIYAFRGASDKFIREIATDDNFKKYYLVENYRNPPNIIKFADEFLNSMPKISPNAVPVITKEGYLDDRCSFKDAAEEMTWTKDWTGWAVLCRTNSEVEEAQKYLNQIDIPNVIVKRGDLDLERMGNLLAENRVKIMTIHACLSEDTLVPTTCGLMTIKQIVDKKDFNIKVFNGEDYESVEEFIETPPQKTIKINTTFGNQIEVSENHDVIVLTSDGKKKVKAKDLKGGEELLLKCGIKEYLSSEILLDTLDSEVFDVRTIKYPLPKFLNEELSELIGLITADGTYNNSSIHYLKEHKECVDRFAELIYSLFNKEIVVKRSTDRKAWFAECNSKYILKFLKKNFDGIVPNHKKISSKILQTNQKNQCAFLRGLFEDGTIELKGERVDNICLCFKNDEMRIQLQTIMSCLGIPVSFCKRTYKEKTINYLYIYSTGINIFKEKIGFITKFKQDRLSLHSQKYDRRNKSLSFKEMLLKNKEDLYIIGESRFWNNLKRENSAITREGFFKYYNKMSDEQKSHPVILYIKNIFENYEIEPIISIERQGEKKTYCLTMKNKSQFIQNGFLMGNSKGLEFPNVVVIGGKTFNQEERRICYVAATRAMQSLYWCPTIRTYKGKARGTTHSAGNVFSKSTTKKIQF